jgi:hypothetical protein
MSKLYDALADLADARQERNCALDYDDRSTTTLSTRFRTYGCNLTSHPVANGTIDCTERAGAMLIEAADELDRLRAENARLLQEREAMREALNTAGGALFRLSPACIEDDEDRAKAEHARSVGLSAVEAILKGKP